MVGISRIIDNFNLYEFSEMVAKPIIASRRNFAQFMHFLSSFWQKVTNQARSGQVTDLSHKSTIPYYI